MQFAFISISLDAARIADRMDHSVRASAQFGLDLEFDLALQQEPYHLQEPPCVFAG